MFIFLHRREHGGDIAGRRVLVEDAEGQCVDVNRAVTLLEKAARRAQVFDNEMAHAASHLDVARWHHLGGHRVAERDGQ